MYKFRTKNLYVTLQPWVALYLQDFLDGFIVNLFSEKIVQVSTEYLTEASSHPNELYLQAYCANDLSWQ